MDFTATSAVFGWDRSDVAEYRQGVPAPGSLADRCAGIERRDDLTDDERARRIETERRMDAVVHGRVPFDADCPLCTGDNGARALCDGHAEQLSNLTFSAEQLEAAAER